MFTGRSQSLLTLAGAVGTAWLLGCMNPTDSANNNESLALSQSGEGPADDSGTVGKTEICHIPPGNPGNAHTLSVGSPAVMAHLAHGDKLGRCEDKAEEKTKPCADKAPKAGPEHGGMSPDVEGAKASVCHMPPGNVGNAHTIVVGLAAVAAHIAHGDVLGVCAGETEVAADTSDCGASDSHHGHDGGSKGGDKDSTGTDGGQSGGSDEGGSTEPTGSNSNY